MPLYDCCHDQNDRGGVPFPVPCRIVDANGKQILFLQWADTETGRVGRYDVRRTADGNRRWPYGNMEPVVLEETHPAPLRVIPLTPGGPYLAPDIILPADSTDSEKPVNESAYAPNFGRLPDELYSYRQDLVLAPLWTEYKAGGCTFEQFLIRLAAAVLKDREELTIRCARLEHENNAALIDQTIETQLGVKIERTQYPEYAPGTPGNPILPPEFAAVSAAFMAASEAVDFAQGLPVIESAGLRSRDAAEFAALVTDFFNREIARLIVGDRPDGTQDTTDGADTPILVPAGK